MGTVHCIVAAQKDHPVFGNFEVKSRSGVTYEVEVRDVTNRRSGCTCADFQVNGLGTCKHVESVLPFLQTTRKTAWAAARKNGPARIDIVPDTQASALVVERNFAALPRALRSLFDADGRMFVTSVDELETALARLREAAASAEEQARVTILRAQALERFKLARFLVDEDLGEEGLAALRETVRLTACACAVEQRMGVEPVTVAAALAAPHDRLWGTEVETMKALLTETPTADQRTAAFEALAENFKIKS